MKKVLMVLGFALCTSVAFAQTAVTRHDMPRGAVETHHVKDLMKEQPVDYKASIFSKVVTYDTNHIFRFNEQEWHSGSDTIKRGYISATDHIWANGHDSVFGNDANAVNVNNHSWCQFRRFADTTTFLNTWANYYSSVLVNNGDRYVMAYLGEGNQEGDAGWQDDGFVVLNYEEQVSNFVNLYMEFPTVHRAAQYQNKMVWVSINQFYAKYYDACFIDYWYNNRWNAREINVDGIDASVGYLSASKARYVMPTELASQTDVKIRIRACGPMRDVEWYGYGWCLDNVAIVTCNQTESWDFAYTAPIEGFYGMIPRGMSLPVSYGAHVRNDNLTDINNATMTLYAGPIDGNQPAILTSQSFNFPTGDPLQDYKMYIDERGFVYGGDTMFDNGLVSWLGMHPNYGNTTGTLIGGYLGRSLPTNTVGANLYKIRANGGSLSTLVDSVLYTVSNQLVFSDGQHVNGYRWGRDNGLIPSNSNFQYAFTPGGYVTSNEDPAQADGLHSAKEGYTVHMAYTTGNTIPEGWVLKGIEYVPATDGAVATGEGLIYPYVRIESYSEDGETMNWTSVATGIDGLAYSVTEEDIDNLPITGYALPPTGNTANYSAVNVFFTNQPALLPNTTYRIGYILNQDGNFHVASQATSYDGGTYRSNEETAPYARQNTPLPTYQVYVEDPVASRAITAWNIDYFPMIRPIVGPREPVATVTFLADCTNATDTTGVSVNINSQELCGDETGIDLAVGGNYSFIISGGTDHTIVDHIYVNGQEAQIYDPEDPEHDTPVDDPYYLSFYNTDRNNDNVEVPIDAQGHTGVALYRGYYVLHFNDLEEVSDSYVITADFHWEEWIELGIDPVAPESILSLYPNPATSTVKLNITNVSGMVDCSIIDMSGRVVYTSRINAEVENTINVSNMPAGAYFVRVTNDTFSKIEKLIIK